MENKADVEKEEETKRAKKKKFLPIPENKEYVEEYVEKEEAMEEK